MVTLIDLVPRDGDTEVPVNQGIVLVSDMPIDRINAEKNIFLVEDGSSLLAGPDSLLADSYLDFYRLVRNDVHKNEIIRVKARKLNEVSGANYISWFDPKEPLSKNKEYQLVVGSAGPNGTVGLTSQTFDGPETSSAILQDVLIEKVLSSDNITFVYVDDTTAGSETVDVAGASPDYTVTVHIEAGVSTSAQVAAALIAEPTFFTVLASSVTALAGTVVQQEVTQILEASRLYVQRAYTGVTADTLVITIVDEGGNTRFDWYLASNPTTVMRSKLGPSLIINDITLGFIGAYEVGESWHIPLFAPEQLDQTYCNKFSTGELDCATFETNELEGLIEDTLTNPSISPLTITGHEPALKEVEVSSNIIRIYFSADLDPATILPENFSVIGTAALDVCGLFENAGSINFDVALDPQDASIVVMTLL